MYNKYLAIPSGILATTMPMTNIVVCMKGYPIERAAVATKIPRVTAQMDMQRMKRLTSRVSGDGAGLIRAARPATRPSAVRSPQHRITPKKTFFNIRQHCFDLQSR